MDEQERERERERVLADPTALTTQQLLREVESLEKLFNQRMQGMEEAVRVAHDNLVRVPTEVDKAIGHLKEVVNGKFEMHAEKFNSVQTQFQERDVRTEQTAKDSKVAVDAALQAAKEAVGKQQEAGDKAIAKSEAATTKQIDQILLLIATNTKASDDKINDLKERFAIRDGSSKGVDRSWGWLVGGIGMVVAVIGLVFSFNVHR